MADAKLIEVLGGWEGYSLGAVDETWLVACRLGRTPLCRGADARRFGGVRLPLGAAGHGPPRPQYSVVKEPLRCCAE